MPATSSDILAFFKDVRERFRGNPRVYQEFYRTMAAFKNNSADANAVVARVQHLFRAHSDLILGFYYFLPEDCHQRKCKDFLDKVRDRFKNEESNVYKTFLGLLSAYRDGNKSLHDIRKAGLQFFARDRDSDLLDELWYFLPKSDVMYRDIKLTRIPLPSPPRPAPAPIPIPAPAPKKDGQEAGEKKTDKLPRWPTLSERQRLRYCSASYRSLPEDYKVSTAGLSEVGISVLNATVVSVGRQYKTFGGCNTFGPLSDEREDELFELDMTIEALDKMIKRAEDLMEALCSSSEEDRGRIRIEDYLNDADMSNIRIMYAGHGDAIVNAIRGNLSAENLSTLINRFNCKLAQAKLLMGRS